MLSPLLTRLLAAVLAAYFHPGVFLSGLPFSTADTHVEVAKIRSKSSRCELGPLRKNFGGIMPPVHFGGSPLVALLRSWLLLDMARW